MFGIKVQGSDTAVTRYITGLPRWVCDVCRQQTDKYSCPNCCGTRRPLK